VSRKKKESGSLGEMVRRGAERLARDPRAQRTAKKGVSQLLQRFRRRLGWRQPELGDRRRLRAGWLIHNDEGWVLRGSGPS
jgi:hypothetical protein